MTVTEFLSAECRSLLAGVGPFGGPIPLEHDRIARNAGRLESYKLKLRFSLCSSAPFAGRYAALFLSAIGSTVTIGDNSLPGRDMKADEF